MGFFSWLTCDTNESIPNIYNDAKDAFPVKMIDDKGNCFVEDGYEGYGVFGDKDFYVLLAEMNGCDMNKEEKDKRLFGMDLCFRRREKFLSPKLVTENCTTAYEDLDDPKDCEHQGYFYGS